MTIPKLKDLLIEEIHEQLVDIFFAHFSNQLSRKLLGRDRFQRISGKPSVDFYADLNEVIHSLHGRINWRYDRRDDDIEDFYFDVILGFDLDISIHQFYEMLVTAKTSSRSVVWPLFDQDGRPFTLWTLAEFIATLQHHYRGESINICGQDSLESGVFLGIEKYVREKNSTEKALSPSTRISEIVQKPELDAFWNQIHRANGIQPTKLKWVLRPFESSAVLLGCLFFIFGLALVFLPHGMNDFISCGFFLLIWSFRSFKLGTWLRYFGNPIPTKITTFGDLAGCIATQRIRKKNVSRIAQADSRQ